MNVGRTAPLPPEDLRYVGQIVAQRTGLSQQGAEQRVADVYAKAQAQVRDAEVAARAAADSSSAPEEIAKLPASAMPNIAENYGTFAFEAAFRRPAFKILI